MNYSSNRIYDLIGVGVGPFNLGLCALLAPIDTIESLFFEIKKDFSWHSGMLISESTLQVPFLGDLVTMVDPKSKYSFLNYLHEQGRLYQFCCYENFYIPRIEYSNYCKWVSKQFDNIQFSSTVTNVNIENDIYRVDVRDEESGQMRTYRARHIVIGTGAKPATPAFAQDALASNIACHSSTYLFNKETIKAKEKIAIVGSGQSAAEIFLDLARSQPEHGYELYWLTRGASFSSMDYSKLISEHFSPGYIKHFHRLNEDIRFQKSLSQSYWYKGISSETINEIYDHLYNVSLVSKKDPIVLQSCSALETIEIKANILSLGFRHVDLGEKFHAEVDHLVLATGYNYIMPDFLKTVEDCFILDSKGFFAVDEHYKLKFKKIMPGNIYVQNAEIHSHGVSAPDLVMGASRSARIINDLVGGEYYPIKANGIFQTFGINEKWKSVGQSSTVL